MTSYGASFQQILDTLLHETGPPNSTQQPTAHLGSTLPMAASGASFQQTFESLLHVSDPPNSTQPPTAHSGSTLPMTASGASSQQTVDSLLRETDRRYSTQQPTAHPSSTLPMTALGASFQQTYDSPLREADPPNSTQQPTAHSGSTWHMTSSAASSQMSIDSLLHEADSAHSTQQPTAHSSSSYHMTSSASQQSIDSLLREADPHSTQQPTAHSSSTLHMTSSGASFQQIDVHPGSPPTEPDCFSTELDSGSDSRMDEVDTQHEVFPLGEFAEYWAHGGDPGGAAEASSSSPDFDSELTENEDPNFPTAQASAEDPQLHALHWSMDPQHDADAERVLSRCMGEPWFSTDFFWDSPRGYHANYDAARVFISGRIEHRYQFKIGITEDPHFRWFRPDCGYHGVFETMFILYSAATSKTKIHMCDSSETRLRKRESSGAMEKRLIRFFANGTANGCLNREGAGGENPSNGTPHFVYVVVRADA